MLLVKHQKLVFIPSYHCRKPRTDFCGSGESVGDDDVSNRRAGTPVHVEKPYVEQLTHRLEPVYCRVLEIVVEAHVVEGEEPGAHEAEGDDEQEPVLRRVEGRRCAHHAQDGQRLQS